MDNIIRIKRVSRRFRWIFSSLVIGIPIFDSLFWLMYNHLPASGAFILTSQQAAALDSTTLFLLFVVSLIPVSVATYGMFILSQLFRLYERGIVFSAENVKLYRRLGFVIIGWVVAIFVHIPLSSIIETMNNAPGERNITLGFEIVDSFTILVGMVVIVISWVMDEGRQLEDEQSLIV